MDNLKGYFEAASSTAKYYYTAAIGSEQGQRIQSLCEKTLDSARSGIKNSKEYIDNMKPEEKKKAAIVAGGVVVTLSLFYLLRSRSSSDK